ncbi:hypothetical protein D3C73_1146870 [compost metagenome]
MEQDDAEYGRRAGARGNSDDIRVSQGVAEHRLKNISGRAEREPGEQTGQHSRQADRIYGKRYTLQLLSRQRPDNLLHRINGIAQQKHSHT